MAKTKTGTSTIIVLSRKICRLVGIFGASDLQARTSPEFKSAVDLLVAACHAFEAADDFPGQIDRTAPNGPEDLLP